MERTSDTLDVMLIDEVATALKITAKQIRRLERRGSFPIPRLAEVGSPPKVRPSAGAAICLWRDLNPDDSLSPSRLVPAAESPDRQGSRPSKPHRPYSALSDLCTPANGGRRPEISLSTAKGA